MEEQKQYKFCTNCGANINIGVGACPMCGAEQSVTPKKISNLWYLLPIFFSLLGGIIAWVANRDKNPKKARSFLIWGIAIFILSLVSIVLTTSISFHGVRERAGDASIQSGMYQLRSTIFLLGFDDDDYSEASCSHPDLAPLCSSIKSATGKELVIHARQDKFCAYTPLLSEGYFCIDSDRVARKTTVYPGNGYCDGIRFNCP